MRNKSPWKRLKYVCARCFSLDPPISITYLLPPPWLLMYHTERNVVYVIELLLRYQGSLEKIYIIYSYTESHAVLHAHIHTYIHMHIYTCSCYSYAYPIISTSDICVVEWFMIKNWQFLNGCHSQDHSICDHVQILLLYKLFPPTSLKNLLKTCFNFAVADIPWLLQCNYTLNSNIIETASRGGSGEVKVISTHLIFFVYCLPPLLYLE